MKNSRHLLILGALGLSLTHASHAFTQDNYKDVMMGIMASVPWKGTGAANKVLATYVSVPDDGQKWGNAAAKLCGSGLINASKSWNPEKSTDLLHPLLLVAAVREARNGGPCTWNSMGPVQASYSRAKTGMDNAQWIGKSTQAARDASTRVMLNAYFLENAMKSAKVAWAKNNTTINRYAGVLRSSTCAGNLMQSTFCQGIKKQLEVDNTNYYANLFKVYRAAYDLGISVQKEVGYGASLSMPGNPGARP